MIKRMIAICTACFLLAGTASADSGTTRYTDPELMEESVTEAETAREAEGIEDSSGNLFETAWKMLESTADEAGKAIGDAADEAGKMIGGAADEAGKMIGGAVDEAGKVIGGIADQVMETIGGAADTVRETAGSAWKKAEETAGKVQDTAEELSEEISETAQKAREDAERTARKWNRVFAYLEEKISHTDITPEDWDILESGFFRAVDNAYRQGWIGENASLRSVHRNADFVFQTIKKTYQYMKGESTAVDYATDMLLLAGEDQSGVLLKLFAGILPVEEAKMAAQITETVIPILVAFAEDAWEDTEDGSVSSQPEYSE